MRYILAVLTIAALTGICGPRATAATPPAKFETPSVEGLQKWIYGYRIKPDLKRVPGAIRAMAQTGALKDPEASGIYIGFIAGVLGSNPGKADRLIEQALPVGSESEWAIVRAIAYSGLPGWKRILRNHANRLPSRKVMIEKYLSGQLPALDDIALEKKNPALLEQMRSYFTVEKYFGSKQRNAPPEITFETSPELLDTLWGYYFATGSRAPVLRMVQLLPWSSDNESVEKLTVGNMAKFTLASNAARDVRLLAILKGAAPHQPKAVAPVLAEVIDAAETVEIARIRREARASLEELQRKGPNSRRNMAWWGKVGEGAIALGCIAAAATGQVQLGLPCVLGGAASSAALKFWSSP